MCILHLRDGRTDGLSIRPSLRWSLTVKVPLVSGSATCNSGCIYGVQVFMAMSVAGVVFDGYFFAFHLLNIVHTNQLLRGVIQAVTQNGALYKDHRLSRA